VIPLPGGRLLQQVDQLSREQARDAAAQELTRRPYLEAQPPLLLRVIGRVLREIGALLERAAGATPAGPLGLLLLVVLVGALIAVLLVKVRPQRSAADGAALFDGGRPLSADDHRQRAEAAAQRGQYAEAVRERLRAVVRELESRGVLDPRPGRTADEVAREAGAVVPEVSDDLVQAARLFDEVWYGGRPADPSGYAVLVEVDRRLTARRLAVR
jgi:hypothetical protein